MCYEKLRVLEKAIEQWEKIYVKKPTFRDVAEKLSQYQELRHDDRVKDYLTAPKEEFFEICKAITTAMGRTVRDVSEIPNGCQIIALESESSKWRNARKMPMILRFLRMAELIDDSSVRSLNEEMKKMSVMRGVILTSSGFTRVAQEFVESRPIDLIGKEQLLELLKKIDL